MSRNRFQLTPDIEQTIVSYIRSGGYDWVAAQAAGIPRHVFLSWLHRGASHSRQPYRRFYERVQQAKAQVRVSAEVTVKREDPLSWLRYGPGRETPQAPGWTAPVITIPGANEPVNVLETVEWITMLGVLYKSLSAYPEALEAALQTVQELEKRGKITG